jgi:hypothetical protein
MFLNINIYSYETSIFGAILSNQDLEKKLEEFFNKNGLIFFFKIEKEIFGASESSRLVFASLKDKSVPKDSQFLAFRLSSDIEDIKQKIFSKDDFDKLKVIDEKEAIETIKKKK